MSPDVSKIPSFIPTRSPSSPDLDPRRRSIQVKNRRLHYLRTHPQYFIDRAETLRARGERVEIDNASGVAASPSQETGDRIGGPISANLLEAYDLDRRLESRRTQINLVNEQKDVAEEDVEEEEEDTESEDSAASDAVSSARRAMVEAFLAGRDDVFDYASIDDDPAFDDLVTFTRDEQEKFFDEEEEAPTTSTTALESQTGILDY